MKKPIGMHSFLLAGMALCAFLPLLAQTGAKPNEWRYYGGDAGSTRYSPLDQINADNVKQLEIAWRWKAQNFGARADVNWEVTPLMVNGVLYFTAGTRRDVIAADAATGETLWMYRIDEGERGDKAARFNNRGVGYWSSGQGDDRIFLITPGYQLVALNAKTGQPIPGFGKAGVIDLWNGLERSIKVRQIGATSPAIVVKDVVIVGAALLNGGAPESKANAPGFVQAFDVHTGKHLWTFHTIAQQGEFGADTWADGSNTYTGNTAVWAPMSADLDLGYVYLPVEAPTGDFYGGHRHGDNLFGNSLVCLDARTGKRIWHYQIIHHDIWDFDNPAPPILLDVTVNGQRIKAVAQVTKQAFVYTFDRVTGKPVWPIVEKPVPQSDVPDEKTSATQPFPTKPPAFDRQGLTLDDLVDFTPEIKAEAVRTASQYRMGPLFTPGSVYDAQGKLGTLSVPESRGGANWQGAAADPETGVLYVPSVSRVGLIALTHDTKRSDMEYITRGGGDTPSAKGLPLVKPPWGRITAIDMNTGDFVWQVANGPVPEYIKNNPSLKGIDLSKAGNPERAPLLVTKTLLFAGDGSGQFSAGPGGGGTGFRALDKKTGETLFEMQLPTNETGIPMTYMLNGRQYIVVAIGSRDNPAELIALALPQQRR